MKVTVLITTYMRARLLERCIHSALKQDYEDFEILIIDDGSTDGTQDLLKEFKRQHPNILDYRTKKINAGLVDSRNLGVQNAKGEVISFLDDDDYWLNNDVISKQVRSFIPKSIVCGSVITSAGQVLTEALPQDWRSQLVYRNGFIHTSTVMLARDDVIKAGLFDTRLTRGIDSDLYRRLVFQHNFIIKFMSGPISHYELNSTNRITTRKVSITGKIDRLLEAMYQLRKYVFLSKSYPKEFFKRFIISIKKALS